MLLPLGKLSEPLEVNGDADAVLWEALTAVLHARHTRPDLERALEQRLPELVLLLDGLDELSTDAGPQGGLGPRQRIAQAIRHLARSLPRTPIIVTCRVLPYRTRDPRSDAVPWQFAREDGWGERAVQPFTFGQVRQFVYGWYQADAAAYSYDPDEGRTRADGLLDDLEGSLNLRQAIAPGSAPPRDDPPASPLLLTMLTILHANAEGRPLPTDRDDLYEQLVGLLLYRWEPRRSKPDYDRDDLISRLNIPQLTKVEQLRTVLHEIAYDAHALQPAHGAPANDKRGIINARALSGRLLEFFRDDLGCSDAEAGGKVRIFVDVLQQEAGLLQALDRTAFALPHLTFQEYLAACHLASQSEREMARVAYRHWASDDADRWREVLLLLIGRLCQQDKVDGHANLWLEWLTDATDEDERPKASAQRQRDALLSADCYAVLARRGALRGRLARKRAEDVRAALEIVVPPTGVRAADLHLAPPDRARAAVALARLGSAAAPADRRPGVCALPHGLDDPYWCSPFSAGSYPVAEGAATAKLRAFRIGRYPVTVWQFRQFWQNAQGYANQDHWTTQGWKWKYSGGVTTQPYRWDEPDWTADNQPVIGVSWYEASAFCTWLTAVGHTERWLPSDHEIRLPSEAEWKVAAMWDAQTKQMRPWQPPEGELWQNVQEAGIGRTAPVGLFPQGASPCGALDMAGNVWEWCCSHYEHYPKKVVPGTAAIDYPAGKIGPALRGESFYTTNICSSWGARGRLDPFDQFDGRGFRVVVCSCSAF